MSPKLPVLTSRELERVVKRVGFVFHRQTGSHAVFYREADGARIVIPMHAGATLKPKTLAGILDDMGLTPDQLREML